MNQTEKKFEEDELYLYNLNLIKKLGKILSEIGDCSSIEEAQKKFSFRSEHLDPIKKIWKVEKKKVKIDRFDWKPSMEWHFEVLKYIKNPSESKEILWIYDPVGITGKTSLSKYIFLENYGDWIVRRDTKLIAISDFIKNGIWSQYGVWFDLVSSINLEIDYDLFINLKDGVYENCIFSRPHVIITACFLPDITKFNITTLNVKEITTKGGLNNYLLHK